MILGDDAIGIIQAVVRDQLRSFLTAELGIVTGIYPHENASDKNNCEVDVRLRDSGLVLKRVAVATPRIGAAAIPNPGDLVVVQYLHGDVHSALVTARFYNDQDRAPVAKAREFVYLSPDPPESGVRRVALEFPKGNKLLWEDDQLVLECGKTKITVRNDGDLVIDSSARLTVTTQGDASFQVGGKLEWKATGDVTIEGMNVSIQGQANATVEGGAATTVKGTSVKVAGQIDFSVA